MGLRDLRIVFLAACGFIAGSLAFVYFCASSFSDALLIRNSVTVTGIVIEKFITYKVDDDGDTFPEFRLRYDFPADGSPYPGTQEVNREFYYATAEGNPITVYFERGNPSVNYIDLAGRTGAKRAGIVLSLLIAAVSGVVLYGFYRSWRNDS